MARPRMKIGEHGEINVVQVQDSKGRKRQQAECRYRGEDGVVRRMKRYAPSENNTKQAARTALYAALEEAKKSGRNRGLGVVTGETAMTDLLERHMAAQRDRVSDGDLARRSIDTYERIATILAPRLGDLRASDMTVGKLKAIVTGIWRDHGKSRVTATQAKTLLKGVGDILVDEDVWDVNKAAHITVPKTKKKDRKAPRALSVEQLRQLIDGLHHSSAPLIPMRGAKKTTTTRTVSQFAASVDLVDPIVLLAYLGLRRSELLGLLWSDYNSKDGTLTIQHHLVRAGQGNGKTKLMHEAAVKTEDSERVLKLPKGAVEMLDRRFAHRRPVSEGLEDVIFPNTVGEYRDPDTFAEQWRRARTSLGIELSGDPEAFNWVGTHAFRKTVATILDDGKLSARQIADAMGHSQVSMTLNTYVARYNQHQEAADAMDRAVTGT